MSNFHTPVMLKEVLEYLEIKPGSWYVDCNLGGGGHTEEILKRGGKVIGIDLDQEALDEVRNKLGESENLILVKDNFVNLGEILKQVQDDKERDSIASLQNDKVKIAGILFDLGVSSHQMDEARRGFSFSKDAPLDMRMDKSKPSATAADLVNGLHEGELTELFLKLGEESFAKPIARRIIQSRKAQPITSTSQLAKIVESVKKRKPGDKLHPATQVFQALRIAVNDELNNLKDALPKAFGILEPGGRLVIISFHSLEDRIVKEFMREIGEGRILTKKPVEPSEEEVLQNPKSRSAKLRVMEKRVS